MDNKASLRNIPMQREDDSIASDVADDTYTEVKDDVLQIYFNLCAYSTGIFYLKYLSRQMFSRLEQL